MQPSKIDFRFSIYTPKKHLKRHGLKGKNNCSGNYLEKCPVRIWKSYTSLLIDLLISNNFSSISFFCATRILRVIGHQSIRQSTDFLLIFWHNKKKQVK